ncbi:hypothetical protein [Synechococcus elongatus]|uniref:Uncharacterized protein n=2 Tax=Synechococcus elongatus TaxID=32046 RepID=Q31QW8_SYNE7|nr:hypothetical protein [Synechococcus elongatus]ABB56551.1 hypothetical protein Synpcc7942_0519 [Synechococcus elongatus PCC 7942 = FACHB-805]AJD56407.1 hypothetical protein M744_00365 [Synechococcus elongatus UTEX 2973]MBD2588867.1 hypothetical protein [Synechococcus elongatus FACHB-242]MBD2689933.1 hypothetical protein [Synechococcus elongatus FACHB-1061]MBD2706904.1 hypothetical protein [Synechococcus elongatus PCC 7942 = FACHB-805]
MTDSVPTIPDHPDFGTAIALAQQLLALEPTDAVIEAIARLVASRDGARGFFVTYLTSDEPWADQPAPALIAALRSQPTYVEDLMVRNLAMSTAMGLTHERNADPAMAAQSQRVSRRSAEHLRQLQSPSLRQQIQDLQQSLTAEGPFSDFLDRWGYDAEQRAAIASAIAPLLD